MNFAFRPKAKHIDELLMIHGKGLSVIIYFSYWENTANGTLKFEESAKEKKPVRLEKSSNFLKLKSDNKITNSKTNFLTTNKYKITCTNKEQK